MTLNNINTESPSGSPYTEEIRRVVHEELPKNQRVLSTDMYSRIHDLIRASSIDIQNRFSTSSNYLFTSEDVWGNNKKKKNVPGHPGRFLSSGEKIKITSPFAKSKTVSVSLFNKSTSEKERYHIDVNKELLIGYIEIQSHFTESHIRSRLVGNFPSKLSIDL